MTPVRSGLPGCCIYPRCLPLRVIASTSASPSQTPRIIYLIQPCVLLIAVVLALEGRRVLGPICEIFGRTDAPMYTGKATRLCAPSFVRSLPLRRFEVQHVRLQHSTAVRQLMAARVTLALH
jgi:hypothetical protein